MLVIDCVDIIPLPSEIDLSKCIQADYWLEYECSFSNESIIFEVSLHCGGVIRTRNRPNQEIVVPDWLITSSVT